MVGRFLENELAQPEQGARNSSLPQRPLSLLVPILVLGLRSHFQVDWYSNETLYLHSGGTAFEYPPKLPTVTTETFCGFAQSVNYDS